MRRRYPEAIAVLAIALGISLRLADLPSLLLFGDEYHGLDLVRKSYASLVRTFDGNGTGTALLLLRKMCFDLFGANVLAYRLPAIVGGIAGLLVLYPIARPLIGRPAAAIATLALAANPLHAFYSHFSRSYSLATFGCLVLLHALQRLTAERPPLATRRGYLLAAVSAALVPYIHLSALGVVVSLGGGAIALLWFEGRSRREIVSLALAFTAAALLCVALYLPIWTPFFNFYRMVTGVPNPFTFGILDVGAFMTGSPAAALVCVLGVPAAAVWMIRSEQHSALLLVPAAFLPIALLALRNPVGSEVSHAHYLITSIPFMLMLMSWAIVRGAGRLFHGSESAEVAAIAAGAFLVALAFWDGPLGRDHSDDGPFANTYISQQARPRFDVPFPGTPDFYATLAAEPGEIRIIEAPALVNLAMVLYRNYYLQHRKEVSLGFFNERFGISGSYVALLDPERLRNSDADYLVLHRDVRAELRRYLEFVEPGADTIPLAREASPKHVLLMRRTLGEPLYTSDDLLVWKLPRARGQNRGATNR